MTVSHSASFMFNELLCLFAQAAEWIVCLCILDACQDLNAVTLIINTVVFTVWVSSCVKAAVKSHLRVSLFHSNMQTQTDRKMLQDDIIVIILICTHMTHTHTNKQIHCFYAVPLAHPPPLDYSYRDSPNEDMVSGDLRHVHWLIYELHSHLCSFIMIMKEFTDP